MPKEVTRYLMDAPHWRIEGVRDYPRFLLALTDLLPRCSVIGLAGGAGSPEIETFLREHAVLVSRTTRAAIPQGEFHSAAFLSSDPRCLAALAELAEHHAEPEIAGHVIAISNDTSVLEWFDAPDDPISISSTLAEAAVSRFTYAAGGTGQVKMLNLNERSA